VSVDFADRLNGDAGCGLNVAHLLGYVVGCLGSLVRQRFDPGRDNRKAFARFACARPKSI